MKYTTVEEPHPTPLFNKKVQVVLAFISTAALFTANYYNPEFSQPVLAAAWILHMARGFTPPQIKMKRVVQFLLAVEVCSFSGLVWCQVATDVCSLDSHPGCSGHSRLSHHVFRTKGGRNKDRTRSCC